MFLLIWGKNKMLNKIINLLQTSSFRVPLQMAFGICKFADSLTHVSPAVVSLYIELGISLVNHLVTWQHSTNQNAVKVMIDLVCKLITDIPNGLERLLTAVEDCFNKGMTFYFSLYIYLKFALMLCFITSNPVFISMYVSVHKYFAFMLYFNKMHCLKRIGLLLKVCNTRKNYADNI